MVTILMMLAKIAALGLLKTKVFWNKDYEVIISVHHVTITKILSRKSSYIVDVVMWLKFESCHNLNFIRIWPEEPLLSGIVLLQVQ